MSMSESRYRPLLDAIAFAARAHNGQMRKDRLTPYVSHVFRVCLILRDLFGVDDHQVLIAAVLHDTIEDTTTDHDDLEEQFGPDVAQWVALLSKDKRRPLEEREDAYAQALAEAPWHVQVCKLADVFDNLMDLENLRPERRQRSLRNARRYLDVLRSNLQEPAAQAWQTPRGTPSDRPRHRPPTCGQTVLANLALACLRCNSHKGPNLAGIDPATGTLAVLFNPRRHKWSRHFRWDGAFLIGRTRIGRTTIVVLAMNDPVRIVLRAALIADGLFPPE